MCGRSVILLLMAMVIALPLSSERRFLLKQPPTPSSLPFGDDLPADDIVTHYELERMAAAENRLVLPDCGLYGLQDGIARWIPEEGLAVVLRPEQDRRVFLYIDFVGFIDRDMESVADELRCRPGRRETVFPSTRPGPYEWAEIYVNGKSKLIVYQGHDVGFTGPVAVPVSRDEFRKGLVRVRIVPSGRRMAIWDVFLSHSPPEE